MESEQPTNGNAERLATQWVRVQPVLMAYLTSALSDLSIAEDVAQEVAVAATRQFNDEQAEKPFTPWIMGIARNQVALYYRKHYREKLVFNNEVLAQIEQAVLDSEQEIKERQSLLNHCIEKLNPKARGLIEMRYSAGLRTKEIADRLGTTANSVAVMTSRIRKALSDCVSQHSQGGAL